MLPEITPDRTTHTFVGRGEIPFDIQVTGNTFTGTARARFYDPNGKLMKDFPATLIHGNRLTLPWPGDGQVPGNLQQTPLSRNFGWSARVGSS